MAFEAVPSELKACPQWVLWRSVLKPNTHKFTKVPLSPVTGYNAATDKPSDWSTFDLACQRLTQYYEPGKVDGLGFVFGYASNTSGVDADNVLAADGTVLDYNTVEIMRKLGSYTELSPSRTGLHTLILANIPSGRRYGKIEIYGQGRFFTVTGLSYGTPLPLMSRQAEADELVGSIDLLRARAQPAVLNWSVQPRMSDHDLWHMAARADNGEKFLRLWAGDWREYPSQSEADFALIDIVAFYTDSPSQVQQMFKLSSLYRREKYDARGNLVLGMIQRSFDRKPPMILPSVSALVMPVVPVVEVPAAPEPEPDDGLVSAEELAELKDDPYILPPGGGVLAEVAKFIHDQAPYPMREAALAAAMAMMAGIVGRQYQFLGSGLNLYIMLLANTGAGKEAMSTGVGRLFDAICNPAITDTPTTADTGFESARGFRGPARLTGKGLMTSLAKSHTLCFMSILTEFAYTLDQMKEGSRNIGQQDMRQTLLDLYMKSSAGNMFAGHTTADKDTTIARIASPAFTLLTESTPGKLYGFLDDDMITSGLLPRFIVIETTSITEVYNPHAAHVKPPADLVAWLSAMCHKVIAARQNKDVRFEVTFTEDGAKHDEEFRMYCRSRLRSGDDAINELWNRAHLNARRVSALAAIGQNPEMPTVSRELFAWAARIIHRQTVLLTGKFLRGETGENAEHNEQQQVTHLRSVIDRYKNTIPDKLPTSRIALDHVARSAGLISWSHLYWRCNAAAAYKKDKRGASFALRICIDTLKKTGELTPANLDGHPGEHYKFR